MPKPVKFKVTNCDLKQTNQIQQKIFVSRGLRVILDADLAKLYGVTTKQLNQQLKRNLSRFPKDFAFQLTLEEAKDVARSRSQIVTLNRGTNIKHAPHVFIAFNALALRCLSSSNQFSIMLTLFTAALGFVSGTFSTTKRLPSGCGSKLYMMRPSQWSGNSPGDQNWGLSAQKESPEAV